MKIVEIQAGMDAITVEGRVVKIGEKREVETKFGKASVTNAVLEDPTGRIILNLWRNQIDLVDVGDIVRIENGFVKTFQDRLELNVGSRGRIVVVSKATAQATYEARL